MTRLNSCQDTPAMQASPFFVWTGRVTPGQALEIDRKMAYSSEKSLQRGMP
jgi:hypothetical protein